MDGQLSFATLDYAGKKKRTKRDAFLAEMVAAVRWSVLEAVIAPHYPKEGPQGGRRAFPIAVMLRRDDDTAVYGDKGYANGAKKRAAEAAGVLWAVKEKAKPGGRLTARQRARNHRFGKVRAKVEHVFRVVKCQFGYRKVRYRGIAKNGAQVFSLL